MRRFFSTAILILLLAASATGRQEASGVSIQDRRAVVSATAQIIRDMYVFEDQANAMADALHAHLDRGAYDSLADGRAFAQRLTADLRAICDDRHLTIEFNADATPAPATAPTEGSPATQPASTISPQRARMAQFTNYGIEKIERLQANVWLLQLNEFVSLDFSRDTIGAAMNFVADANALIIDLRRNSGGNPDTEAFIAGFLFDQPQALSAFDARFDGSHAEFLADPAKAPGPRFGGSKPLYLLTSEFTFSAGEALAYDLQACKRAVIVGERTGGGAHPTDLQRINEHFAIRIPIARPVNPITHSNWQDVGVKPDVEINADRALLAAHLAALKALPRDSLPPQFAASRLDQIIAEKERELATGAATSQP